MSGQKIVNKFRKFGLPVDGVAILRNEILAIGDRTIDVHSCNYGYIRTSGRKRYSKGQQITGCDFLNNVTEDLFLVLIIDEGKSLDAYINAARHILDADQDVTILEIDVTKEAIQRAESIPPSLNKIAKISFQYSYQEVGKCEEGVCEYVADVECDIEPCESKSFCERVQECIEPVDNYCTLQVGSGCCDYSVEVPRLCPENLVFFEIEFTKPENWDVLIANGSGSVISLNTPTQSKSYNINSLAPFATLSDFLDAIETVYNTAPKPANIDIERFENGLRYIWTGDCFKNQLVGVEFENQFQLGSSPNTVSENIDTLLGFQVNVGNIDLYSFSNENGIVNTSFVYPIYTFQVLINSTWTDVTDEVENGTWSRTSCEDTITQWRIIDSEDNVINSGEVTATCEEATEVTQSVCNWLQAHQTAIEELQNNPSGLTCETLPECQTIIDIEQTLTDKANTADLATVATTGSYNDLTDQPTIPAGQIQSDWNQANNLLPDFIKNKPVIPTVPTNVSAFTNDANYITLAQARAGGYTRFFADFAATSVNTNTTNNVIASVLIPANTITGNAIIEIESAISRAVSGANPGHRLFINTSNAFAGATQIAVIGVGTTVLWSKGERSFKCGVGSLRGFSFTTPASIDDTANINAPSATTIDWTVDQYILTVVNNATGVTTTHEYTTVKVLTV